LKKYQEYKYMFTDKSKDNENKDNVLFPLWRFDFLPNKRYNCTAICWNPKYKDLFAAAYGSYEFGKKFKNNVITLFSLKNSSYPEKIIQLSDSAKSLDFHPH
jgi:dynein intermediate chain 1